MERCKDKNPNAQRKVLYSQERSQPSSSEGALWAAVGREGGVEAEGSGTELDNDFHRQQELHRKLTGGGGERHQPRVGRAFWMAG